MKNETLVLLALLTDVDDKLDALNVQRNGINLTSIISDITTLLGLTL